MIWALSGCKNKAVSTSDDESQATAASESFSDQSTAVQESEAGTGAGCENGGCHTEAEGSQGTQHQLDGFGDDQGHILHDHTVVIQFRHDQGNNDLHSHLADHAQGA